MATAFASAQGPRQEAEKYLKQAGKQPRFATTLINVLLTPGLDEAIQQAGAVLFKNHVKYHWVRVMRKRKRGVRVCSLGGVSD